VSKPAVSKPAVSVGGFQAIKFPPLGSIRRRSTCKASYHSPTASDQRTTSHTMADADWEPVEPRLEKGARPTLNQHELEDLGADCRASRFAWSGELVPRFNLAPVYNVISFG